MFYPDNDKRASRLQQLVDSMANMQTDIQNDAKAMDDKNVAIRPQIDKLLKMNGYDTMQQLIDKSMALLTPDQRKQFEAMVKDAQSSKAGFDWTYFAAGVLMLPEGLVLTGKTVMAIGSFVMKSGVIQSLANLFKSGAEAGAGAAAAVAEAAETASTEATNEMAEAGEVGEEVAETLSFASALGTFFKVLGGVGFVVTLVVGIVEVVEGAEQKAKLIDAIHSCQSSRLAIKYFKTEADNIIQNLTTIALYVDAMVGTDQMPANPAVATYLGQAIMTSISKLDAAINWDGLESQLDAQDRTSGLFYGDDDLPASQVVAVAKGMAGPPPPIYNPSTAPTTALKTTNLMAKAPVAAVASAPAVQAAAVPAAAVPAAAPASHHEHHHHHHHHS
jgi:hypothetical protein